MRIRRLTVTHLHVTSRRVRRTPSEMNNSASQKRPRIRLTARLYATLRRVVLERDGWRCQKCGSFKYLDVHHMRRRSALGDDAEENLITLCTGMPPHSAQVRIF